MGLYIDGKQVENPEKTLTDVQVFLHTYKPSYVGGAEYLKNLPVQRFNSNSRCLFINQREFGVVLKTDSNICSIGTDMATTCHMVFLRCFNTHVTALAHFDGSSTGQGVKDMTDAVLVEVVELVTTSNIVDIELHILGGFEDDRNMSERLTAELLQEFNSYVPNAGLPQVRIQLKTFCAVALNNTKVVLKNSQMEQTVNSPVIFGCAMDLDSGSITPAVFDDDAKGPESEMRSAKSLNGVKQMKNVYRPREGCFIIEPFTYIPMNYVHKWLHQPDRIIRKYMSTSPEVEPENFEDHIRATLTFIATHPDPMQSIFASGKPLIFKLVCQNGKMIWK